THALPLTAAPRAVAPGMVLGGVPNRQGVSRSPCPRLQFGLLNPAQGTVEVRKIARTQCLDAGSVVSIERSHGAGTSRRRGGGGGAKPQADVIGVNRSRGWVRVCVRNGRSVHDRGWTAARGDDEGFNAEAADEIRNSPSIVVRCEVALIPGQAERS